MRFLMRHKPRQTVKPHPTYFTNEGIDMRRGEMCGKLEVCSVFFVAKGAREVPELNVTS